MNWRLHPDAALDHEEQVTYYEQRLAGLGAYCYGGSRSRSSIAKLMPLFRCWPLHTIDEILSIGRGGLNLRWSEHAASSSLSIGGSVDVH